jgi:hypothetical protein
MKKKSSTPDPDMLDEYDFSNGVRDKYIDRIVISQTDDDSAWEKPRHIRRTKEESEQKMALDTLERLLKQANLLTPNEQLLLATRLIERVRQVNKPMTGKDLLNSGLVGMWAKRKDIGDSAAYARKLRVQAQTRRQT